MKKLIICTFVMAPLALCACGGPNSRRSSRSSSGSSSSEPYSFDGIDKDLTYEEFKQIVINAAHVERDRMSKIVFLDGDGVFISENNYIERFNGRYYYSHSESEVNGEKYVNEIYAYSTADWQHNYYCYKATNGEISSINDYVSDGATDQYIFTFGYGQLGFHPASFIACYGGMVSKGGALGSVTFSNMHQSGNVVEFVMNNYAGSEGVDLIGSMTLTNFGGCELLSFYMTNNPALSVTVNAKTIFDNRNDPPQEIVNIFKDYN